MPLVGKLIRWIEYGPLFAHVQHSSTASAVPVLEALRISAEVVNSLPMKRAVEEAVFGGFERELPIGKSLAARKIFLP